MPPKGKSKAQNIKFSQLGKYTSNRKKINDMDLKISNQSNLIEEKQKQLAALSSEITLIERDVDKLRNRLARKRKRVRHLNYECSKNRVDSEVKFSISKVTAERRSKFPSSSDLNRSAKDTRRLETFEACSAIHGGSKESVQPVMFGMIDTLCSKIPSKMFAKSLLNAKSSVVKQIKETTIKIANEEFYNSEDNKLRSLNVFYSHNVMGKAKYMAIRKANRISQNKQNSVVNYIQYPHLATIINNIDIGTLHDIHPTLTFGDETKSVTGNYRSCDEFLLRLAKFYLKVNRQRSDKLKTFNMLEKKDFESFLFVFALGGDGAPICGMSFLVSFLNVGNRICSSSENFLIFGGDTEENSTVVRNYVLKLLSDVKFLESQVFTVYVDEVAYKVEFLLGELPNDMKMLAFLAGELTNSAYYFSTFGNVNKDNSAKFEYTYGTKQSDKWMPFNYHKRISDAKKVEGKKKEIEVKCKGNSATKRSNLTSYISKVLKGRQEEVPLVGHYIDKAKGEPLHLKNNVVKEHFMKLFNLCLATAPLNSYKAFKDIPSSHALIKFVNFIRSAMGCNFLSKKIIRWFNESSSKNESSFTFRFRGKESKAFLCHFPELNLLILNELKSEQMKIRLHQIHFQFICLRKIISLSVRVENFNLELLKDLKKQCKLLFKSSCWYDVSVSPSLWTLCNCIPFHAESTLLCYGFGIGCNSMEGREQKHQMIVKYSNNTTFQCRWPRIFHHEYIQLLHLRENGYDKLHYVSRGSDYIPERDMCCEHCLLLVRNNLKCQLCESAFMKKVFSDLEI
ncbi:uncharacterized protein LOC130628799 [Hydractinia symbiolongicarpus]|uniref:uncharacterized protein LOC130628799 n=1 Tax=Hydractinia symbiolongicarpus TaxID=13093 RepID=UPI00254B7825|nr:uncharacterized protein LOC130628799 [Hydractinia symbiolongicarpus]